LENPESLQRRVPITLNGATVESYQLYLIAGLALIGLEIFVPGFVLAPLGLATLVMAGVAWLTDNLLLQSLAFTVTAGFAFWGTQKFAKLLYRVKGHRPGDFGIVGKQVTLIEPVQTLQHPGRVKLFADEFDIHWEKHIPKGCLEWQTGKQLTVKSVLGNRVIVEE
jgi:membrane protein implicated in regulation of membrane protease activity